jgi:site-specific recombinase XerD
MATTQYIEQFLAAKRAAGRSESTLSTYQNVLLQFALFVPQWPPTVANLQTFLLYKQQTTSKTTTHTAYKHVSAFLLWCERQEFLESNPLDRLDRPKPAKKLPRPAPVEELQALFAAIEAHAHGAGAGQTEAIRDLALFRLAYDTGARVSELAGLSLADLNLARQEALIRNGKGDKDRVVYFGQKTGQALTAWLKIRPACLPLFIGRTRKTIRPMTRGGIYKALQNWASLAGIRITVHQLRHSYATHALRRGIDIEHIQLQLGHSDIRTTLIYTLIEDDDRRLAHLAHAPGDAI